MQRLYFFWGGGGSLLVTLLWILRLRGGGEMEGSCSSPGAVRFKDGMLKPRMLRVDW